MKRILFNRKFGLLDAVLNRHKTQTRRIFCLDQINPTANKPKWHIGEVVAISQPYKDILSYAYCGKYELDKLTHTKGWSNAMFTKADLMPHHIEITGIKIERLQDIDDESCMKEGIGKYFLGFDSPHTDCMGFTYSFDESGKYKYPNAKQAFVSLIYKLLGKCIWESNPFMFVYEFELID